MQAQTKANSDSLITSVDTLYSEELTEEIKYSARDSITYEVESKKITLYGAAEVIFGDATLTAASIEIDSKTNVVTASGVKDSTGKLTGNPVFLQSSNQMSCEKIIYNTKTKKGKVFGVLTKQAEMLIYGETIKKDSNEVMLIKNAKCIPCEFEDAKVYFRASKAKIIPDDKIVTGPVFLEIAGIKTPLGLPFGYFPNVKNKSKSGVLIPFVGQSPNQGFFLQNGGFYFPLGPKADLELRGDVYSAGSWAIRTASNYLVRYKFNGNLRLEYKEIIIGEKEIPFEKNPSLGLQKLRNFSFNWIHAQDPKSSPGQRFSSNVNVQSGLNNKYNPLNNSQYITNTFFSNVNYSYQFKNSTLSVNARHNQNTLTRDMEISFPELTLSVNRFFPFKNEKRVKQNILDKIGISYLMEAKSLLREKDSLFFREKSLEKIQYGARHSVPISTNINLFKYFTFTPAINLSSVMYMKSTEYNFNEITNSIKKDTVSGFKSAFDANFSANLTTKIFGDYVFKTKRLKQIRHFIIPTIGFTYHPNLEGDQLGFFRKVQTDTLGNTRSYSIFENQIFGGPVGAESGLITYNINNNLEAKIRKNTDTGFVDRKIVLIQNLSVSGNYNLAATDFKYSVITVSGRTRIWKNIDLLAGAQLDPYALDSLGQRTKLFYSEKENKPLRYSQSSFALNASFTPDLFMKSKNNSGNNWSFNLAYNISHNNNPTLTYSQSVTQTLNFAGNLGVGKNWRIGFNSGFDFKNKNFSYTSMNIYRDLRCWEAKIDWVPFGFNKRYSVSFNLKTSSLRDLKIPRQRQWFDNL